MRSLARRSFLLLAACATLPRIGAGQPASAGDEVTVAIDNFTFTPAEITIPPGTTVTWVNHDDIPHTVVDEQLAFRSKPLDTEDRFQFTFTQPGAYSYFCSLHPHMTGKVLVKP